MYTGIYQVPGTYDTYVRRPSPCLSCVSAGSHTHANKREARVSTELVRLPAGSPFFALDAGHDASSERLLKLGFVEQLTRWSKGKKNTRFQDPVKRFY